MLSITGAAYAQNQWRLAVSNWNSQSLTCLDATDGGDLVVVAGHSNDPALLDGRTGRVLFRFGGHVRETFWAAFLGAGDHVVTGSGDGVVRIFDVRTGSCVRSWQATGSSIAALAVLDKGGRIATAGQDGRIRVWDEHGGLDTELVGHSASISELRSASGVPDLFSASDDGTVRAWDSRSGVCTTIFSGHETPVKEVESVPGRGMVVTVSGGKVRFFDQVSGELSGMLEREGLGYSSVQLAPNGSGLVLSEYRSPYLYWYDLDAGVVVDTLLGHAGNVIDTWFSSNGTTLVSLTMGGEMIFWDTEARVVMRRHEGQATVLDEMLWGRDAGDHPRLFVRSEWGGLDALRLGSHGWERLDTGVTSMTIRPDGKVLLIGRANGQVVLRSLTDMWEQAVQAHDGPVRDVAFLPSGEAFATVADDGRAKVWDGNTLTVLRNLVQSDSLKLREVAVVHDGRTMLSSSNRTTQQYKVDGKGKNYWVWGRLMDVADRSSLAVVGYYFMDEEPSWKRTLDVWRVRENRRPRHMRTLEHDALVYCAEFSPDERWLATGTADGGLVLWDVHDWKSAWSLQAHEGETICAAFNSEGTYLATGSSNGEVVIWDVPAGRRYARMTHSDRVTRLSFTPDGRFLAAASWDGRLTMHEVGVSDRLFESVQVDDGHLIIVEGGYYAADKDVSKKVYYVDGMETLGFDQLDLRYNRPDKVLDALGKAWGNVDTSLVSSYRRAWQKRIDRSGLDTSGFGPGFAIPDCRIIDQWSIAYEQPQRMLDLHVVAYDSIYLIDRLNVYVNEVPVHGSNGIEMRQYGAHHLDTTISVHLSTGVNKLEVSAMNVNGVESYRTLIHVHHTPVEANAGRTWFVGIALDQYAQEGHELRYAVKDIRDLAEGLKARSGDALMVDTLFDKEVTRERVRGLKQRLSMSSVDDRVVMVFSGHGLLSREYDYYLSTWGVDFEDPAQGGLPYEELEALLDSIPARQKLLLIDACHSGEVDREELLAQETTLPAGTRGAPLEYGYSAVLGMKNSFELMQELFANVSRGTGATVISAAGGTQFAYEGNGLDNGVFTASILELLRRKGHVRVSELKEYVGRRVVELTNGNQRPTTRTETVELDWEVW